VCVALFYLTDIGKSLRSRGHSESLNQGTWGGRILTLHLNYVAGYTGPLRGWAQTNFVELWSVSRPRLAEMAIEIWVMCQLTQKLFETSSVR